MPVESDLRALAGMAAAERLAVGPLVSADAARLREAKLRAEAYWRREVADMQTYFQLAMPRWGKGTDVRGLVQRLNALSSVEIAYAPPVPVPMIVDELATPPPAPYACSAADLGDPPDYEPQQGYLSAAPLGIGAVTAWTHPGGRGTGIRVVDIEGGYREHADHKPLQAISGHQVNAHREHGRAVVGVLASLDNGVGTTGVVSDASILFRSIYNANLYDEWEDANADAANVASHVYWASQHSMGGVVLIELQGLGPGGQACPCPGANCLYVPMEYWPEVFDQIQTATGNGVVVVEAAANGGRDLDHAVFMGAFDLSVQDSGAIMVGGSESATRVPICRLNSGSRVSVHSWGEDVVTAANDYPLLWGENNCNVYHDHFNGTSSASAIVAGAVASLQGIAQASLGYRLDPLTLRQLLIDTGTPQAPGPNGELIGPQPNLAAAIEALLP
jgi:serine protease